MIVAIVNISHISKESKKKLYDGFPKETKGTRVLVFLFIAIVKEHIINSNLLK